MNSFIYPFYDGIFFFFHRRTDDRHNESVNNIDDRVAEARLGKLRSPLFVAQSSARIVRRNVVLKCSMFVFNLK
jgi:hypothetical protein